MSELKPSEATGLIRIVDAANDSYGGTCCAFRQPHVVLTASHCVPSDAGEIFIDFPYRPETRRATQIERHPSADIAIIFSEPDEEDDGKGYPEKTFWDCVANWSLGEDFYAFGFPTEGPFQAPNSPTPRIFRGYYQRFIQFEMQPGRRYLAGEINIPAPAGLSGGPVFRPGAMVMLTGLVTSNVETYSILHSIDEMTDDGRHYREESRRVIQYGIVAMLSDIKDWLDEFVPHRLGTAYNPEPS